MLITSNGSMPAARFKLFWAPENVAAQTLFLFYENTQNLAIFTLVLFLQDLGGCWITRFVHVAVVLRERESVLRAAGALVLVAGHPPPTIVPEDI